ncbi:MAG: lytic murein transglycosylase [Campylobacterales bacterium]|nr:lytic murein transglycosylase [Campylobacterales bacterium]
MLWRITLFIGLLGAWLEAGYHNCDFRFEPYEAVCKEAVKLGASYEYINRFLLSKRSNERDVRSAELFAPEQIPMHRANEKRANIAMAQRIDEMVAHLKRYREAYAEAKRRYGVSPEIVAAILMKESRLGSAPLGHEAFAVFNTLLHRSTPKTGREKRLQAMAVLNMAYLLHHCERSGRGVDQCRLESSYAGAIGIPQFMPQNLRYVEAYGEGEGNLSKQEDAIVSTARYLHDVAGFSAPIDWEAVGDMRAIEAQWYDYAQKHKNASFALETNRDGKALRCFTCKETSMREVGEAVRKLMRYNHSSHYGVGVLRLAYEAQMGVSKP